MVPTSVLAHAMYSTETAYAHAHLRRGFDENLVLLDWLVGRVVGREMAMHIA